jgi:AraC-like DNA-binding protein
MLGDDIPADLEKRDNGNRTRLAAPPKGVIDPRGAARFSRMERYEPSARLRPFLDCLWLVEWNLVGHPAVEQRVLPSPHAHLVIGTGVTGLFGVVRGAYARSLSGTGRIVGLRFRVGGLRPLLGRPVATLTDRTVPVETLIGLAPDAAQTAEAAVLAAAGDEAVIRAAESLLEPHLPAPDPVVGEVAGLVAGVRRPDGARRAEALAEEAGMTLRSLQRLFHDYVGVSPKWVIRRYRLQEAAFRLAQGSSINLAELAADLGYFDQAHLARDFARLIGRSPSDYLRSQAI